MSEKKFQLKIKDVRQKTEVAKTDVQAKYDKATQKAFDYITAHAEKEVEKALQDGRTRAYLYKWKWESDDKKTYVFNGIRIMDLLKKGDLMDKLKKYFNPDDEEDGYKVNWHKFKDTEPTQYGLYVSWYMPKESDE